VPTRCFLHRYTQTTRRQSNTTIHRPPRRQQQCTMRRTQRGRCAPTAKCGAQSTLSGSSTRSWPSRICSNHRVPTCCCRTHSQAATIQATTSPLALPLLGGHRRAMPAASPARSFVSAARYWLCQRMNETKSAPQLAPGLECLMANMSLVSHSFKRLG